MIKTKILSCFNIKDKLSVKTMHAHLNLSGPLFTLTLAEPCSDFQ